MATTVPVPLAVYTVGPHVFGPTPISAGVSQVRFDYDRTVGARPLNGAPVTTTVTVTVDISYDGGATWRFLGSGGAQGGVYFNDDGSTITSGWMQMGVPSSDLSTRQARGTVTVGGASVSLSGTLALTP